MKTITVTVTKDELKTIVYALEARAREYDANAKEYGGPAPTPHDRLAEEARELAEKFKKSGA